MAGITTPPIGSKHVEQELISSYPTELLTGLPEDLERDILRIVHSYGLKWVAISGRVCKGWSILTQSDALWRLLFLDRFGFQVPAKAESLTAYKKQLLEIYPFLHWVCKVTKFHVRGAITCMTATSDPDGNERVITGCSSGLVQIWELPSGNAYVEWNEGYKYDSCISSLAVYNHYVAVGFDEHYFDSGTNWDEGGGGGEGDDKVIALRNTKTNTSDILEGHEKRVLCLGINAFIIASGSDDKTLKIWDTHTRECLNTYIGHTESISCLTMSGNDIVVSASRYSIRVWDIFRKACVHIFNCNAFRPALACTNGRLIFDDDGEVKIRDLTTGGNLKVIDNRVHDIAAVQNSRYFFHSSTYRGDKISICSTDGKYLSYRWVSKIFICMTTINKKLVLGMNKTEPYSIKILDFGANPD